MSEAYEERGRRGPAPARWMARLLRASVEVPLEALRFLGTHELQRRRRPPVGATPGQIVVPTGAPAPHIHLVSYDAERVEELDLADAARLAEHLDPGRVTWIDVQGFGDEAIMHQIRDALDVHPLAMADVVHVPQRPKAEAYGDRLLVVTRMARVLEGGEIELEQMGLVLGPGWVATFQERPGDVFEPVRARIRSGASRIRKMGADYLAYALLDAVVDGYFPVTETLGDVIDALEEEVIRAPDRGTLARIHATRRTLLHLRQVQWRQRDALGSLLRDEESPFSEPVRVYLRDAHDHAMQTLDIIEAYREMAIGLMDIYLSSASNRMNEVMKTLTVVASIFIPLTFIVGVYGMNFEYMPELRWRWGYPAVWIAMLALALGLLAWFRRRGWLDGSSRQDRES